jgi:multiple sugar transport system ATP-binding protein
VGADGRVLHLPGAVDVPVPTARVAECARHAGRTLVFGLRPEHLALAADAHGFAVPAQVMLVEPLGSDTLGLVKLGAAADAGEMTGRFPPDAGLQVGQATPVYLATNRFHLFDPESGAALRGEGW